MKFLLFVYRSKPTVISLMQMKLLWIYTSVTDSRNWSSLFNFCHLHPSNLEPILFKSKWNYPCKTPCLGPVFFISCIMFCALFYKVSKPCPVLELQLYRLGQGTVCWCVGLDGWCQGGREHIYSWHEKLWVCFSYDQGVFFVIIGR